eukprot:Gb_25882 [translate_table: standard]
MNPLTQVKNVQKITAREAAAGISDDASWHAKYKESAYVFVGGLPYDLTEGDLLAVFAQYGEIVDVNLIRDKATGKSKGFAFLAYQDQRSTTLAVDNLNGATIIGRTVRVDHVADYKRKKEEDEEEEQRKREERGVCYAFQRGECNRGAACRYSHDEERNANTGWGGKDSNPRWQHDQYEPASHRVQQKKPRYESKERDLRSSREVNRDGDNRSRVVGRTDERLKSEDSRHRHKAARCEDANTKEDGERSKYDERKGSRNRSKDERDTITWHKDDENHMVTAPRRKRNRDERSFHAGSRDGDERDEGKSSRDCNRRDYDRNVKDNNKGEGKYSCR